MEAQEYFYPATFPTRPWMARMRESTLGVHGYYCFDMEAPIGKGTWTATHHAASVAHQGAQLLLDGNTRVAYALCRPPGHHAGPDFFGGYCYLNTAAIATHALRAMGKVAIVDVDYHHGNGTQALFWNEPRVFFGSIHADPDQEYPYFSGYADEVGGSKARGATANYPLRRKSSEEQYLQAFDELLEKTTAFKPDVVVVSLGFDTYEDDPLGFFNVTPRGYYQMGSAFATLGLPLLLVQEGGYNVEALGELAEQFVRGILSA
jgi:acetoin utilization deacetylase AcuC-like enzyme